MQKEFTPCNDLKGYNPLKKDYISAKLQTDGQRDGPTEQRVELRAHDRKKNNFNNSDTLHQFECQVAWMNPIGDTRNAE